jgi:hypothetical protein
MTITAPIPADVRAAILGEAGRSASGTTAAALDLWPSDRAGALRLMWADGADRGWLYWFLGVVGAERADAQNLVAEVTQ